MTENKKSGLLSFLPPPKVSVSFQKPTTTTSTLVPSTIKQVASTSSQNDNLLLPRTLKQGNTSVPVEPPKVPSSEHAKKARDETRQARTEPVNYLIGISNYGDSDSDDDDLDNVCEEPVDDEPEPEPKVETNQGGQASDAYINEDDQQQDYEQAPCSSDGLNDIIKLHGGHKRKRGEVIDIVDVDINEIVKTNKEDLLKNMTKEEIRPARQYTPGGRKKHQITYLAMMAKERDQELKNSWSDSKHNRRIGRQKYGF
jgi:hypothetical protein